MKQITLIPLILCYACLAKSQTIDLSTQNWQIWPDASAQYENDRLFMPPYQPEQMEARPPSCGWDRLAEQKEAFFTRLPATVEQFAWGKNGNDHGICGDYAGVSWFSTEIHIPQEWKGKRIVLHFESARMRAEVYLNHRLVGYELINGTPFTVDISRHALPGTTHRLNVRITDPNGNFAWRDWDSFMWGDYETPPSHGFGGITGKVTLEATGKSFIDNLYIKNHEQPNRITAEVILHNDALPVGGELTYTLREAGKPDIVWKGTQPVAEFTNQLTVSKNITLKQAKLWSPDSPNLYQLDVEWKSRNGDSHHTADRLGFRWFEVKTVDGDRMFFLNGKRIVLHTAISWGHWPVNGLFPTPELARKHILAAKELGMNMLNFHRGIGQPCIFDLADELGLLIYEEPGGYKPGNTDFARQWKREKLLRMVKRDRNHPSLVIYNMINESARDPEPNEIEDIKAAHQLDPTRCITYTSTYFNKKFYDTQCPVTPAPVKMHMLPNDTTLHYQGWWDKHHAGGPGVYQDEFYKSPTNFQRYKKESDEIIFYGEEGAIGTPHRLQLIKEEIEKTGEQGWNGEDMLRQYHAFDRFLQDKGFKEAFPDVDSLCRSLGSVSYYYQGRMIENVRISNNIDGWATNGWEGTKVENHSGIVDLYRNHKADPRIIARYNRPHYVAVKARKKVLNRNEETTVDFYLVNQVNLKGNYQLKVCLENDRNGERSQEQTFDVQVKGGVIYGQLLKENIKFRASHEGYNTVKASLMKGKNVVSTGTDQLFVTGEKEITAEVCVADTSGNIQKMLSKAQIPFKETSIKNKLERAVTLLVGGTLQPGIVKGNFRQDDPLMDWVIRGGTLIILKGAGEWCEYLEHKEIADYRGSRILDRNWFGGNFFVKHHPLFEGLPQATAFNWEYQCFASYNRHREGLRLENGECIVGCYADHKNELFSALSVLPVGKGKIIITTLDFENAAGNAVANKLLRNIIEYKH